MEPEDNVLYRRPTAYSGNVDMYSYCRTRAEFEYLQITVLFAVGVMLFPA
jgi:hypothetical protein